MRRITPLAVLFAAFLFAVPTVAQMPAPARIAPAVLAPHASTFWLANGLQIVVVPDRRLPVVTHMIWYRVGSADEPPGKSGIAHFLEHLLFKGTEMFPAGQFSRRLGEIGGQENAFTSWDYTGYFQRAAKEHLPLLMAFEADRMLNVRITEEVVAPERDVILEERKQVVDNNPSAQFAEQMANALYQNHPYRIPIIGWEHEMRGLTRDDALAFYERWYTPNNAVVVIAGDVTEAEVRALAEQTYARVRVRAAVPPRMRPSEPPPRAPRRIAMTDPRVGQSSWSRAYMTPSYGSAKDGTAEALEVLGDILGSQTGRIYRALVVDRQLAAIAGAFYSGSGLDSGRFGLSATPRPNVTFEQIEQAIDAVIAAVVDEGVTADEVDRSVNSMLAASVYAQDSMGSLARIFGNGLMQGQTFEEIRTWTDRIARVTPEQVNAAARQWLDMRRSVTGTLARGDAQRPRS